MNIDNLYKILQIKESATDQEIKNAYKKLILKYHPYKSKSDTVEQFQLINYAYSNRRSQKRSICMKNKKWISLAAAVVLAVTAVCRAWSACSVG